MKKIVYYIFAGIESVLLFIIVGAVTTAIAKHIQSTSLIHQFKQKGVYQESLSSSNLKVYTIQSNETLETYQIVNGVYYPGNTGDIILSLTSEMEIPFVHGFVSFFAGGHAALVLGDYEDQNTQTNAVNNFKVMEATGLNETDNYAEIANKTYWVTADIYQEVIVVRPKMTEEQRKKVLANAMAMEKDPYNYSFLFDTKNKSYCSDLISKTFDTVGINLNKDSFTTSIYDILISNETYISYYHYYDSQGVKHVYYLD
ncbi:MAG: hypothetical protein K2I42_04010 [Anaeroplasmataceae bacterium]|nr:hypothetical protein [Anaeroplasmataceae bacterium]